MSSSKTPDAVIRGTYAFAHDGDMWALLDWQWEQPPAKFRRTFWTCPVHMAPAEAGDLRIEFEFGIRTVSDLVELLTNVPHPALDKFLSEIQNSSEKK